MCVCVCVCVSSFADSFGIEAGVVKACSPQMAVCVDVGEGVRGFDRRLREQHEMGEDCPEVERTEPTPAFSIGWNTNLGRFYGDILTASVAINLFKCILK